MKKSLFIILVVLFSLPIWAQNGHLKFQGMPIDGTISAFQQKLQAKGWKYDAETSKSISGRIRVFKGTYAGRNVQLAAFYTSKTQTVSMVRIVIEANDKDDLDNTFNYFVRLFGEKYTDSFYREGLDEEDDSTYTYFPKRYPSDTEYSWVRQYGNIDIRKHSYYDFGYKYILWIDYRDQINDDKDDEEISADL